MATILSRGEATARALPGGRRAHWARRGGLAVLALVLALAAATASARTPASAVILMYHRFGVAETPSTNIRLDQFAAHMALLKSGPYTVLPVPDIIAAITGGRPLPDRTIGITIDDTHISVYTEGWPRLKAAGLPFTLFVNTDSADQGQRNALDWDQIREMKAAGVTIGNHSAAHAQMAAWERPAMVADIGAAQARFVAELGRAPTLFAFPYGEYGRTLRDVAADAGFAAAFGQHSGVVHGGADRYSLPRFALNEAYGDIDRVRLVTNALPLPVTDMTPRDMLLRAQNPPAFGFTVVDGIKGLGALKCYARGGEARIERLGARRIEVRLATPFPPGRSRINCTLPGPQGRWRWLGAQFMALKR